jgi:hypothetical protein
MAEQYILKRNLIRDDGSVVAVGQPLPDDIAEDVIAVYLEKGIIRKKRAYKPAPKPEEITGE